jgi:uncharacterized protein
MDWAVYWFMLPVSIGIATIAMSSGISGAALLSPVLIIGFPLLGVPKLAPASAIGLSLFTEFSGFSSGVVGYVRRRLFDIKTCGRSSSSPFPSPALPCSPGRSTRGS